MLSSTSQRSFYVGNGPMMFRRDGMEVVHPLNDGLIEDWDAWESVVSHALVDRLGASLAEHPLLLSEPSFAPASQREKVTQILFEKFNVPALFLSKEPVLTCFANARSTGLVVDCGGAMTVCTPVYDGFALGRGVVRSPLGGDKITEELMRRVEQKTGKLVCPAYSVKKIYSAEGSFQTQHLEHPGTTDSYRRWATGLVADDLKHSVCRVFDTLFDADANANIPCVQFELPDGQILDVGPERFVAPDILFDPSISILSSGFGSEPPVGVHRMIHNSIAACEADTCRELYSNIIITGGCSLLQGFTDRVNKELVDSGPSSKIKIIATNYVVERKFSVWLGGSILASLGAFHQMWMSQHEYKEYGASLVDRKCP